MLSLACLLLLPGQVGADATDFPRTLRTSAVSATVRIDNLSQEIRGSGVVIGRKGSFVYVLTASHVVGQADRLEVVTFSAHSDPKPHRVYRSVRVVAQADDTRDLALLRVVTDDPMPGSLSLCPARFVPLDKRFKALSVGCAEGETPICLVDEVAGKKRVRRLGAGKAASCWEVDRKQPEGMSGGPLIDRRGYLLGVCSGTNRDQSYFCHADEIRAWLTGNGFGWLI